MPAAGRLESLHQDNVSQPVRICAVRMSQSLDPESWLLHPSHPERLVVSLFTRFELVRQNLDAPAEARRIDIFRLHHGAGPHGNAPISCNARLIEAHIFSAIGPLSR